LRRFQILAATGFMVALGNSPRAQKSGVKSPHSKALRAKFPNTRILFRASFESALPACVRTFSRRFLPTPKDVAQFVFSTFQSSLSRLRQVPSGAIDVKIQHRHRRLIRRALSPRAPFSGAFQRERDLAWIF
jgi:hypothetical protein